jgi:hypothetical protein
MKHCLAVAGCVYQISCRHHAVEAVHRAHDGGVTALAVGRRVCATAGRDCRLRIWRLDFAALLLEVHFESFQKPQPTRTCIMCGP